MASYPQHQAQRQGWEMLPSPLFLKDFELSEYLASWRELVQLRSLNKDDVGLGYLSLLGEIKSFFDDLDSIFGCAKGDAISSLEGRSVQSLNTLRGSGLGSGQAAGPVHGQRTHASTGLRSVPLGAREKRREGEKRKGSKGPQSIPLVLKKSTR
ncbi:hypothetical protein AMTR_s00011p00226910 [Amborella trichopoda]|uniref:Uncharacterized protein n=1 Tax=Amborella trichopoda TaxID=13333 RepID=W1NGS9_AMBTC|nr:hypothetical protein AMTR_s00011p00226910 [Amborella trichopoda]